MTLVAGKCKERPNNDYHFLSPLILTLAHFSLNDYFIFADSMFQMWNVWNIALTTVKPAVPTLVTWQWVVKTTLAKGSDRPSSSAAIKPRPWYRWHRSW